MTHRAYGFTIVELLIVVVVIAILAAITIVSYAGISNNAHDTTVKSDLSNFAKKLELVRAEVGKYPTGGRVSVDGVNWTGVQYTFPNFSYKFSRGSYYLSPHTIGYCEGPSSLTGAPMFRILTQSKSGQYFEYTSTDGLVPRGKSYIPIYEHLSACEGIDAPKSFASTYNNSLKVWSDWTN